MPTMTRTVNNNQLTPGNIFFVRGKVGFSRISRQTTDEERANDNLRRMHKVDKNYTTISIYNAQVIAKNPQTPTLEEIYAAESCYNSSKAADYPGLNYTAMNKSQFLPKVGVIEEGHNPDNGPSYKEIQLAGELQKGTDVTLVLRVFAGQGNNGVSLDTVLINQSDFEYYGNNANVQNALSAYGITFTAMSPDEKAQNTAQTENMQTSAQQTQATPQQAAAPQATSNIFSSFGAAPQQMPAGQAMSAFSAAPQGSTPFDFSAQQAAQQTAQNAAQQQDVKFGVGAARTY